MGWTQQIEYIDVAVVLPPPVKKQVWDGEKFVSPIIDEELLEENN